MSSKPENSEGVEGGKVWGYRKESLFSGSDVSWQTIPECILYSSITLFFMGMTFTITRFMPFDFIEEKLPSFFVFLSILSLPLAVTLSIMGSVRSIKYIRANIGERVRRLTPNAPTVINVSHLFYGVAAWILSSVAIIVGLFLNPSEVLHGPNPDSMNQAYMQEYGYTEVDYPFDTDGEKVKDATGKEIEVGVLAYKDTMVLYETPEQFAEKMHKVDAGTFLQDTENTTEGN